jgi:Rps23 Pro-64 3,4-dihydroxylase Tpa1-like proline 4-hydroxylase
MVDIEKYNISQLRDMFLNASPFNHIVIDDFLDTTLAKEIELELRNMSQDKWINKESSCGCRNLKQSDNYTDTNKFSLNIHNNPNSEKTKQVIDLFSSPNIIKFIEDITSIYDLYSDETLLEGGVHKTTTNGNVSVHCDFGTHPETQKYRRISLVLYLNSDWKPEYNGCFELWDRHKENCDKKIEPISNRLLIFKITDPSLHGNTEKWLAPEDYPKLSLDLYYYTDHIPQYEINNFNWSMLLKKEGVFR